MLDQVCLEPEKVNCVPQIDFFSTSTNPNIIGSDGVLGLKPTPPDGSPIEVHAIPSLMKKLIDEKIVSQYIIGISIQRTNEAEGQIRFGGYNTNMMYHGAKSDIHWYDLPEKDNWQLTMYKGAYGSHYYSEGEETFTAEFNPASPLISVP